MKKQHLKPFFSIIIPTYNRSKYLACAIQGVLQQSFKNYELIISDNASPDDTQKVMSSFTSKQIRYYRNKKNIGWIGNIQNAIHHAQGEYIFLHGDDDYMFGNDCLSQLYGMLSRNPCGLVRMNYLTFADKTGDVFDVHHPRFVSKNIKAKSTDEDIISYIQNIDPFFITGQIFANKFLKQNPIIQSEYVPWFPAMYEAIKKMGSVVVPENHIITSWSQNDTPRYRMKHGAYAFEKYYMEVQKHTKDTVYKNFLHRQLRTLISEFPAARYHLSLKEFWKYALHVLDLDKTFCGSFYFWFYFLASVAVPKFVLHILKAHFFSNYNKSGMVKENIADRIAIFQKIKEDTKEFV